MNSMIVRQLMRSLLFIISFVSLVMMTGCSKPPEDNINVPKFKIDRQLFPYQSRFITLNNGTKIHYIDEGEGPVILLLHGNPTWSFLYRHIIADLKDNFRLIAPDYPGFGLSYAPDNYSFTATEHAHAMSEFVQKMDLEDMGIMMQDWGGPIGFHVALQNPDRVSRFIIGNTWAWPLERSGHKAFSAVMGGWLGQFGSWCCNGVARFFMRRGVVNKIDDNELSMYLAPFNERRKRRSTHIFPAQLRDANKFLSDVYSRINTLSDRPALLVWGMKDFAFQAPERSRFESIFHKHQTVLLENAGHFIQEDAPDEIIEAIREFYKKKKGRDTRLASKGEI